MLMLPAFAQAATSVSYNYTFADNSKLASGKWVKIYTSQTGIYELSYDQLRNMGFSDPENVSVFGNGAVMYPANFTDYKGTRQFEDDLQQVAVIHNNDKLYFYSCGASDINFNGKKFSRSSINVYSYDGVYLLTDSATPKLAEQSSAPVTEDLTPRTDLYDYVYYEQDNIHNLNDTGQLFWDYDFNETPKRTWNLNLPYARTDIYNILDMVFVASTEGEAELHYGFGSSYRRVSLKRQQANTFLASNPDCRVSSDGTAELNIEAVNLDGELAGFDYWLYSYVKNFTAEKRDDFQQERLTVPSTTASDTPSAVTVPEGAMVLDVSNAKDIQIVNVSDNIAYVPNDGTIHNLIVFDPNQEQYTTDGRFEKLQNQNLHALGAEGADMLIICNKMMKPWAEKIADVHREKDNLSVIVVTADQLYNEFTQGLVDPIAYRSMVKMLYQAPTKLKNLLFLGPIYSDMRNVTNRQNRTSGLIGYQEPGVLLSRAAANAMDYFGMATDYISNIYDLSQVPVDVGVGILPLYSSEDGSIAYNKILDYLNAENTDWIVNETLSVSCPGDDHAHDYQSTGCAEYVNTYTTRTSGAYFPHEVQLIDYLGYEKAREMFINSLTQGKLISFYFGHASYAMLTQYTRYINGGNFTSLKNQNLGFGFFAGCELSGTDINIKGIGEVCVTDSPRGLAGSIISTRTVWSNYNYDLAIAFLRSLFYNSEGARTESATIGEAFAYAKSQTSKANDLNYLLIGDPALRVPVALQGIDVTVDKKTPLAGGEMLSLSGKIKKCDGSYDTSFNGKASIKLKAPLDTITYAISVANKDVEIDGVTQTIQDSTLYKACVNADLLASVRVDVKNGEFTAKINVPTELSKYMDYSAKQQTVPLYVGAYDKDKHMGAAGYCSFDMIRPGETASEESEKDTSAPSAECTYDPYIQALTFKVSDNVAVEPGIGSGSALTVSLDGTALTLSQAKDYNCPVPSYTAIYPLTELADGDHTVIYLATDVAGNSTVTAKETFTKKTASAFAIKALTDVVVDKAEFTIDGTLSDNLTLVVLDKKGNTVYSGEVTSKKAVWNTEDVAAGQYRVAVRDESAKGSAIFSNWITVSVID